MKNIISLLFLFLSNTSYAQKDISYGDNTNAGSYIKTNDVNTYYEVYGTGKPIILIHGNKTASKGWKNQIDFFSIKYKVFTIDCRGRGKTELGKDSLTYLQIAKDVSVFIKKLQLDSVTIIGKSDGGNIGLLLGIYYPVGIEKIIIFGANCQADTFALYSETILDIKRQRQIADSMLALQDTSKYWKVEQQRFRMMEFQPNITAKDLQKIQIPVLVISCDRDVIKEEHTFWIYKHIPKANLCIVAGALHKFPTLHPNQFNEIVENYLTTPFIAHSNRFN